MTIDLNSILMGGVAVFIAIMGFLMKREFHRLDKMQEAMQSLATSVHSITSDVKNVMLLRETLSDVERCYHKFFDDKGEKATMWAKIDSAYKLAENHPACASLNEIAKKLAMMEHENAMIREDINRIRKREHWIGNKMTIIVGAMERSKIKVGLPGTDWVMPSWDGEE